MKAIKVIYILPFSVLFNFACSNQTTEANSEQITNSMLAAAKDSYPPLHDTSYSVEKAFSIDSTIPVFDFFKKIGAVKIYYNSKRIDWCARSKMYSLYDKTNLDILTFGIDGTSLFATKNEYDKAGKLKAEYNLFNKSFNSYADVESFYKSDSCLLQAIIPSVEKRWVTINDSLKIK
jgi:hypothetical protein